jgi:ABC-type cobalamin/Fe3+-siderophores transport systems, ATPase components
MLKIRNLNFSYDKIHSLKNINLQVEEPSFITIIGPNGSGKTTLLKNICGLLKSQTGEILFKNRNLLNFHRKELSQLVAIVTQNQETPYDYLVEEIVEMGTYVLDKNIEDKKNFLENIYKLTDIEDFVGRSIQTLSSGEKQRVYFARA